MLMLLYGYHGTHANNIDRILKNGYKESSEKEWFGRGIYFFETLHPMVDGIEEAKSWAKYVKKHSKWAVFKATIESENYIDLLGSIVHRQMYDKIRETALQLHAEAGFDRTSFQERIIYNKLEEAKVDFIRVLVDADKYQGYYSYTIRRPQLQVCVKNHEAIKKNELLESEVN